MALEVVAGCSRRLVATRDLRGSIGGTIINDDEFDRAVVLLEDAVDRCLQVPVAVEDGKHHADKRVRACVHGFGLGPRGR